MLLSCVLFSIKPISKLNPSVFFSAISVIKVVFHVFCHLASHQFISHLSLNSLFYVDIFGHTFSFWGGGLECPLLTSISFQPNSCSFFKTKQNHSHPPPKTFLYTTHHYNNFLCLWLHCILYTTLL